MPKNTRFLVRVGRKYLDKKPTRPPKMVDSIEQARLYRTESGAEKLASSFADYLLLSNTHYMRPQVHPVKLTIQASGYVDLDL